MPKMKKNRIMAIKISQYGRMARPNSSLMMFKMHHLFVTASSRWWIALREIHQNRIFTMLRGYKIGYNKGENDIKFCKNFNVILFDLFQNIIQQSEMELLFL